MLPPVAAIFIGMALIAIAVVALLHEELLSRAGTEPRPGFASCSEFDAWEEADRYFASLSPEERSFSQLDSNRNGVPCEMLIPLPDDFLTQNFDVTCDDFRHRDEAMLFFETYGGPEEDLFRIDSDRDRMPCESLPHYGDFDKVVKKFNEDLNPENQVRGGSPRNCSDFDSWSAANRLFLESGGPDADPHGLDRDRDGVPGEALQGPP